MEDDLSTAKYDPSSGYLTITLTKENKGQEFQDLDLLTKLLAPRKTSVGPTIEVVSSQETEENELVSGIDNLSLEKNEFLQGMIHRLTHRGTELTSGSQRQKMIGSYLNICPEMSLRWRHPCRSFTDS